MKSICQTSKCVKIASRKSKSLFITRDSLVEPPENIYGTKLHKIIIWFKIIVFFNFNVFSTGNPSTDQAQQSWYKSRFIPPHFQKSVIWFSFYHLWKYLETYGDAVSFMRARDLQRCSHFHECSEQTIKSFKSCLKNI